MLKILRFNWFWIVLATSLILFATTLFPSWILMLSVWFGLFFGFRFAKLEQQLADREHFIYLLTILVYPITQTFIKWLIINDRIPSSWFWLNRLEHFCWAIATCILFLPFWASAWKRMNLMQAMLSAIGLVCFLGNLNEFLEYFMSVRSAELPGELLANDYRDTIYDMITNIAGGLVGLTILRISRPRTETRH